MSTNKALTARQNEMESLINSDNIISTVNEMMRPNEVASFKQLMLKMATDSALTKAEPITIIQCALDATRLSLPLTAGQGYIVVYKGKAQLDIGYKGWQMMAKRAGLSVLSDVVTDIDDFTQEGFGHNLTINLIPSPDRKVYDDKWLAEHAKGVVVSVKEIETNFTTTHFVEIGMIRKLQGMSPSANSDFSPYKNWLAQMYRAKAIKYVLSSSAIDVNTSIQSAVEISNKYESMNQQASKELPVMDSDRFNELLPQWSDLISQGSHTQAQIIANVNKKCNLNPQQTQQIIDLKGNDIVEGEIVEGESNAK